jgi:membrane protease YdiL (CAAX protease family)
VPVTGPPRRHLCSRPRLALEFAVIFVAVPLLAGWQGQFLRRWVVPQLLLLAGIFLALLWRDPSFDRQQMRAVPRDWRRSLLRIVVFLVLGGAALVYLASRSGIDLFFFPRERPFLWLLVLMLYPLLSALAQEIIFRVFLFHRYRRLFPDPRLMMLVSASAFALAHLQLGNLPAPVLTFLGGLMFAYTFGTTRSLPMVTLEHGLWGDWIFTLGLGVYFYGGHL